MQVTTAMKVDPGLVVDLAALGIATALMLRLLARLDPRYSERSQAQKEGHKRLAARLSSLGEAVQQPLVLKEHEMEVAADVVCPDEIAVSFRDVGGLDEQVCQRSHAGGTAAHSLPAVLRILRCAGGTAAERDPVAPPASRPLPSLEAASASKGYPPSRATRDWEDATGKSDSQGGQVCFHQR